MEDAVPKSVGERWEINFSTKVVIHRTLLTSFSKTYSFPFLTVEDHSRDIYDVVQYQEHIDVKL